MNSFRPWKKSKDAPAEAEGPAIPKLSGRTFRRNKKQPEMKPQLDLANALPSSDNFRTSLLMPKMSARFSMLREQDDPTSKIGKASDDSVLPKRSSRFGDLSDILEAPLVRPSYATSKTDPTWSNDGYATDDDSTNNGNIMNRSRPGEGNVLFGGRQKVYKVPTGGSSSNRDLPGLGQRFLYEQDVHMSSFQRFRAERQAQGAASEDDEDDLASPTDARPRLRDRSISPPFSSYDRYRETSSSTASVPSNGRTSTAATSVASQGVGSALSSPAPAVPSVHDSSSAQPERSLTKNKRLYEQGLDQHIHEQQSSALTRLDQLSRQRVAGAGSPPPVVGAPLSHASNVSSLREPFERAGIPASKPVGSRALSPPPASRVLGTVKPHNGDSKTSAPPRSPYAPQSPPMSPIGSDGDDTSIASGAFRPWDRNMASASGPFNKPKTSYDEHQYSQRQLQMQQGSMTPPLRRESPSRTVLAASIATSRGTESNAPSRSGSESSTGRQERATGYKSSASSRNNSRSGVDRRLASSGTFLAALSGSESEGESDVESKTTPDIKKPSSVSKSSHQVVASPRAPESRDELEPFPSLKTTSAVESISADRYARRDAPSESEYSMGTLLTPVYSARNDTQPPSEQSPPDLSGLVRQHLRTDSGQSSAYGASPRNSRFQMDDTKILDSFIPPMPSIPVDMATGRELKGPNERAPERTRGADMNDASGNHLSQDFSLAPPSLRLNKVNKNNGETRGTSHSGSNDDESPNKHIRELSADSQKEREAFANELAQRRRVVQENLRSFAEAESRAASPTPDNPKNESPKSGPFKAPAFGILKPKGSQTNLAAKAEPTKAMKMLGMTASEKASDGAVSKKSDSDRLKEEEDRMLQSISRGPKAPQPQMRNWGQIRRDARRELERRQRETKEANRGAPTPQGQSPPRPSPPSSSSSREWSGSDPAGRSRSQVSKAERDLANALEQLPSQSGARSQVPRPNTQFPGAPPVGGLPGLGGPHASSRVRPSNNAQAGALPRKDPSGHINTSNPPGSLRRPSPIESLAMSSRSPTRDRQPSSGTFPPSRKRPVHKSDISEPKLVCSTSDITTVSLPPGASLANGMDESSPPPVPPLNPRRRTKGLQMMSNALGRGSSDRSEVSSASTGTPSPVEEGGASDVDSPRSIPRLWKTPSEGMTTTVRPRHPAMAQPSVSVPVVPQAERRWPQPPPAHPVVNGAMF